MSLENGCEQQHQPQQQQKQNNHNVPSNWRFRRILAQFLATTVKNLILFDIGLQKAIGGIIIPALTGLQNQHNLNETLSLTPGQASWLGSIGYILVPIGCFLSGFIADALGRRRAMLIVNIPFIIAWFMMYRATSVVELFLGYALLGFGVGLTEAPIITYIGEITEASMRGLMLSYSSFSVALGIFFVFTLNTLISWRMACMVCMVVPILTMIGLLLVPETPMFLLSKNRTAEAEKSLQWLRGWVPKSVVTSELQELQRYTERSQSCDTCITQNQKCSHPLPTMREKMHEIMQPQTIKPFFITISVFAIGLFSGITGMMPFIVQIFKAYDSPMEPDQTAAIFSFVSNLGIFAFLCLVRFTGKRPLYLAMLGGIIVLTAIISAYGFICLPSGYTSFDTKEYFTLGNHKQLTYIPFICIILWNFCTFCSINAMGWLMLSEVFPYKTRGIATGITSGLTYVINFIVIKTYYNLETSLSLPGITLLDFGIVALGWILMYNILPETENRTLEDIEVHFSDKTKKITNHKIAKLKKIIWKNERNPSATSMELNRTTLNRRLQGCENRGFVDAQL